MKQLKPNKDEVKVEGVGSANSNLDGLYTQIAELENKVDLTNAELESYKQNQSVEVTTENVNTNSIKGNSAFVDSIKSETIESDSIHSKSLEVEKRVKSGSVDTEEVFANKVWSDEAEIGNGTIDQLSSSNATITSLQSGNITADTLHVREYRAEVINADEFNTENIKSKTVETEEATTKTLTAEEIKTIEFEASLAQSTTAYLQEIRNEQVWHNFYHTTLDAPSTEYTVIELPYFMQGKYALALRNPESGEEIFSVVVTNAMSNLTFAYSRKKYNTDEPATLYDVRTKDYNEHPQLYLRTQCEGELYWHYEGLDKIEEVAPKSWSTWPFNNDENTTQTYRCFHRAATVFTQHIDYGDNTSPGVGGGVLFIVPSENWNKQNKEELEYDGKSDVPFTYYTPNQSLNTDDRVTFKAVSVDELAITSITENFMFLRSRADGTFEVVLAVNNDYINGVQNIQDPITSRAIYNWNGIALGGEVELNDFIRVNGAYYVDTWDGATNTYKRSQYTFKEGTPSSTGKAIRKKIGENYLYFEFIGSDVYGERIYNKYEVKKGDYAGFYYYFFTDDGELYETNQESFINEEDWSIPDGLFSHSFIDTEYYTTGFRFPVLDSEGTNEYHLKHLGDETIVHGSAEVQETLTVKNIENEELIKTKDLEAENAEIEKAKIEKETVKESEIKTADIETANIENGNVKTLIAETAEVKDNHVLLTPKDGEVGIKTSEGQHLDLISKFDKKVIADIAIGENDGGKAAYELEIKGPVVFAYYKNFLAEMIYPSKTVIELGEGNGVSVCMQVPVEFVEPVVGEPFAPAVKDGVTEKVESVEKEENEYWSTYTIKLEGGNYLKYDFQNWDTDSLTFTGEYQTTSEPSTIRKSYIFNKTFLIVWDLVVPLSYDDIENDAFLEVQEGEGFDYYYLEWTKRSVYKNTTEVAYSEDDGETFHKLAERDDRDSLEDNTVTLWKDSKIKTVPTPFKDSTKLMQSLVAERSTVGGEWEIHFSDKGTGSGSGAVLYLTQEELKERLKITDENDENYIPNDALVVIKDYTQQYVKGEFING